LKFEHNIEQHILDEFDSKGKGKRRKKERKRKNKNKDTPRLSKLTYRLQLQILPSLFLFSSRKVQPVA